MWIVKRVYIIVTVLFVLIGRGEGCREHTDCNSSPSPFEWFSYCDHGTCKSQDSMPYDWLCVDSHIPIFNEPKCQSPTSIKDCQRRHGTCLSGYCCPSIRYEPGRIVFGEAQYVTNFPCNTSEPVHHTLRFSYCHPIHKRIVVLGKREMQSAHRWTGKTCRRNSDCKSSSPIACVHLSSSSDYECLRYSEPKDGQNGKMNPVGVVFNSILALVFGVVSIISYLLYRYHQRALIHLEEAEEQRKERVRKEWNKRRMVEERKRRKMREDARKYAAAEAEARKEAEMKAVAKTVKEMMKIKRINEKPK